MTIQTTVNKVVYLSDGIALEYAFNFITFDEASIRIFVSSNEYVDPFTVLLNIDQQVSPGGTVTLDTPVAEFSTVTILREVDLTQETDYQEYDPFPALTHERALDNLTLQTQQLQEEIDRAYKSPIDSQPGEDFGFPPYDAGALLGWSETEPNQIDNSPYTFADIEAQAQLSAAAALQSQGFSLNSEQSALLAERWASEEEDVPVDGSLFSARHYAIKALRARGGLNLVAIISGDDLCPKPGDDPPSVCVVPDTRNPGQRFADRPNLPGDYFILSQPGTMELKDPTDASGPTTIQAVETSDYIIYLPEVVDDNLVVIVGEGWYKQSGLAGEGGSADTITFDDSVTIIKGTSVQAWNEAADDVIEANRTNAIALTLRVDDVETVASDNTDSIILNSNSIVTNTGLANAAQGSADAANVNANTRKLETDFIRTGDRLDINNVGVA